MKALPLIVLFILLVAVFGCTQKPVEPKEKTGDKTGETLEEASAVDSEEAAFLELEKELEDLEDVNPADLESALTE